MRRELGRRVKGALDFSVVEAQWGQADMGPVAALDAPGVLRPAVEQFHDISGSIETEIPETATRVSIRCRISGAFEGIDPAGPGGLDARFDLLINQALPFTPHRRQPLGSPVGGSQPVLRSQGHLVDLQRAAGDSAPPGRSSAAS